MKQDFMKQKHQILGKAINLGGGLKIKGSEVKLENKKCLKCGKKLF
jgi:hypothetical protein